MNTKTGGLALKLEAIPVGSDGWFSLFEPKAKDEQPRRQASIADEPDDAPF
jgi:hypothetical protein